MTQHARNPVATDLSRIPWEPNDVGLWVTKNWKTKEYCLRWFTLPETFNWRTDSQYMHGMKVGEVFARTTESWKVKPIARSKFMVDYPYIDSRNCKDWGKADRCAEIIMGNLMGLLMPEVPDLPSDDDNLPLSE